MLDRAYSVAAPPVSGDIGIHRDDSESLPMHCSRWIQPPDSGDDLKTIFQIDNQAREAVKCVHTDSNQAEENLPR